MFCNPSEPEHHFPRLKGKAAELRHLARPLLVVWRRFMDRTNVQHKQIEIALDCSGDMEEIVSCHTDKPRLPPGLRKKLQERGNLFLVMFNAIASHYSNVAPAKRLFDITIKAHYLAHTLLQSEWLHPKYGWCYSGEDFMMHTKRLHARCTHGNSGAQSTMKFCQIYRIGLHCIFEKSRRSLGT